MKIMHALSWAMVLILGVAACNQPVIMEVYGDESGLDSALHALAGAYAQSGHKLLVGSKYEVPDLVIINGLQAVPHARQSLGGLSFRPDSVRVRVGTLQNGRKTMVYVLGTTLGQTKQGISEILETVQSGGELPPP